GHATTGPAAPRDRGPLADGAGSGSIACLDTVVPEIPMSKSRALPLALALSLVLALPLGRGAQAQAPETGAEQALPAPASAADEALRALYTQEWEWRQQEFAREKIDGRWQASSRMAAIAPAD